ncbi:hypothetical protein ACTMU2_35295 [Cupriavidus basilensis]
MMTPVLLMQAARRMLGALLWRAAGGYWLMLWTFMVARAGCLAVVCVRIAPARLAARATG